MSWLLIIIRSKGMVLSAFCAYSNAQQDNYNDFTHDEIIKFKVILPLVK